MCHTVYTRTRVFLCTLPQCPLTGLHFTLTVLQCPLTGLPFTPTLPVSDDDHSTKMSRRSSVSRSPMESVGACLSMPAHVRIPISKLLEQCPLFLQMASVWARCTHGAHILLLLWDGLHCKAACCRHVACL